MISRREGRTETSKWQKKKRKPPTKYLDEIFRLAAIQEEEERGTTRSRGEGCGAQPCCSYCCCCSGGDNLLPIIPLEEDESIEDKKVERLYCCCFGGDFLLPVIPSEDGDTKDEAIEDKKGERLVAAVVEKTMYTHHSFGRKKTTHTSCSTTVSEIIIVIIIVIIIITELTNSRRSE